MIFLSERFCIKTHLWHFNEISQLVISLQMSIIISLKSNFSNVKRMNSCLHVRLLEYILNIFFHSKELNYSYTDVFSINQNDVELIGDLQQGSFKLDF